MGFFKKIASLFDGSETRKAPDFATHVTVKCNRCGELIIARIDLRNDLSIEYGETTTNPTYFSRKTLIGENRCYQQIEIELTFDSKRKIIARQISGGTFIDDAG